ncbi:SRPBCC domain-containing protein [Streptomyces sp. NPDC089424]|uniref:SRPBCC domain-containing protein n=1 Tax=Streptomyces sp. NPDC089424 TaxID=3365917 RepID=UPI0038025EFE
MEHEVFVPVSPALLGAALADPARVARAVPGLQQEAGAEPVAGRLKVRVGSHSITYRGTVRVTARDDGSYAVEGEASEARGTGAVELALTVRLRGTDGGTTLTVQGGASADGRITELPADTVHSAVTRLLDRTAEKLATDAGQRQEASKAPVEAGKAEEGPVEAGKAEEGQGEEGPVDEGQAEESQGEGDAAEAPAAKRPDVPQAPDEEWHDVPEVPDDEAPPVLGAEVPPPSLDPTTDDPDVPESDVGQPGGDQDSGDATEPPAEAAHARRTMIGRSAEEVDHAPPRGRYAPVPAPQTVAQNPTLRWAAPAAALVVAGAIVLGRALRRRQ